MKKFEEIIKVFSEIHIPQKEKCFMDICQYPGSRYEEICSRILAFYFNPNEEHKLRDLWFRALNNCVNKTTVTEYSKPQNIKIELEERTDWAKNYENRNKRIDILIETANTVYCIENKIGAQLYNNLEVYSEHLKNKYPTRNHIKIVLTAHNLNAEEKIKVEKCDFKVISYKTLFEEVNLILGDYYTNNNIKHLIFMTDFMQTLNNKMNFMENPELSKFFFKNQKYVRELIKGYNEWQNINIQCQTDAITDLLNKVKEQTKDNNWWIYDGWDLGIFFNDRTDKKIGIESSYSCDDENDSTPLARFKIYITTWGGKQQSLKCWSYYKNEIMQNDNFKNCFLDECNSDNERVYLHAATINGDNRDEIITKLNECYSFLKDLADKVAKQ